MKLTAKTIASVKLPDGKLDVIYFDDALPGFGFRMRMSGGRIHRSWIVQYRRAGSSRRYSLGSAEVLSADQARAAAKVALGKVALGGDPQAEKIALRHRDAHTLKTVVDDYLAAKKKIVRPNRYRELNRYLAGPSYFKRLHAMPIDQISRRDVAARLTKITSENGPIVAGCARAALSAFFAWSMAHGLAEQNPVVGTLKPDTGQPRERVLSDPEIVTLWRACGDDAFGKIVKLLLLTDPKSAGCGGRRSTWRPTYGRCRLSGPRTSGRTRCRSRPWRWRSSAPSRTCSAAIFCSESAAACLALPSKRKPSATSIPVSAIG
jgi:hypothetical protein